MKNKDFIDEASKGQFWQQKSSMTQILNQI